MSQPRPQGLRSAILKIVEEKALGTRLGGQYFVHHPSIMPKIPEISVGVQMERSVSVPSDRNIWDHLLRWSTNSVAMFPSKFAVPFLTNCFFALIKEFGKII